jgi:D-glucosaminate-6-phosphate ammonia-lyase
MRTCGIYIGAQEDNSILLNPLMLTSRQVGIVCEALKQSMREMKREENKNGCN